MEVWAKSCSRLFDTLQISHVDTLLTIPIVNLCKLDVSRGFHQVLVQGSGEVSLRGRRKDGHDMLPGHFGAPCHLTRGPDVGSAQNSAIDVVETSQVASRLVRIVHAATEDLVDRLHVYVHRKERRRGALYAVASGNIAVNVYCSIGLMATHRKSRFIFCRY